MKPMRDLTREMTRSPSSTAWKRGVQRVLQMDAAAGLSLWLRSLGEYVEPYDWRKHDWETE